MERDSVIGTLARPEMALLLCCAQTVTTDETAARIRDLVATELDWEYVVSLANNHQVVPLLYHNLNMYAADVVPTPVMALLRKWFDQNSYQTLLLVGELLRLLELFKTHDIEAVPIKGPMLAQLYGNPVLRSAGDLDIWIQEKDVLHAKDLLVATGYVGVDGFTPSQEVVWVKSGMGYDFVHSTSGIMVDIHINITSGNSPVLLPVHEIWRTLEVVPLMGTTVLSPSLEYRLLFLCIHGAKHCWAFLKSLCDLAEFIRAYPDLNWDWIFQEAARLGQGRIVLTGLYLVNRLLDMTLPPDVVRRVEADPVVETVGLQLVGQILGEHMTAFQIFYLKLRLRERVRDRITYAVRLVFIPRHNDMYPLPVPRALFFVYYLLRPVQLIRRGFLGLFGVPTLSQD